MTVVIEQPQPEEPSGSEDAAILAGAASADVAHLEDEVAEVTEVAEVATITATAAAEVAAESVSAAQLMIAQGAEILEAIRGIASGMTLLAEMFDTAMAKLAEANEPPPEPPKRDTKPNRRSDAHRFLYG